jgi:hypothetical protein
MVPVGHERAATSVTAASLWAEPSIASSTLTTSSLRIQERKSHFASPSHFGHLFCKSRTHSMSSSGAGKSSIGDDWIT